MIAFISFLITIACGLFNFFKKKKKLLKLDNKIVLNINENNDNLFKCRCRCIEKKTSV